MVKSLSILDFVTTEERFKELQDYLRQQGETDHPWLKITFEEFRARTVSIADVVKEAFEGREKPH